MDGHKEAIFGVQGDHLQEGVVGFFFCLSYIFTCNLETIMASGSSRFTGGLPRPFAQVIPIAFCILATVAAQDAGFHDSWDVFFSFKKQKSTRMIRDIELWFMSQMDGFL